MKTRPVHDHNPLNDTMTLNYDRLKQALIDNQDLSSVQLAPILQCGRNTINVYRKKWDLPWTRTALCACGCGKSFTVVTQPRKYHPDCSARVAREMRHANRKMSNQTRGWIHRKPKPTGKTTRRKCLICGQWDDFADNLHIHESCKASKWGDYNGSLHEHGYGRIYGRHYGGDA